MSIIDWDYLLSEAQAVLKSRSKGVRITGLKEKARDLVVLYLDYNKKPDSTPFRLMWSLSHRLNYIPPMQLKESHFKSTQDAEEISCASDTFLSLFTFRNLFFMWGQLAALSCTTAGEISRVNDILEKHIKARSVNCPRSELNCNFSNLDTEWWIETKVYSLGLKPLDSYCVFEWGITPAADIEYFSKYGLPRGRLIKTVDI